MKMLVPRITMNPFLKQLLVVSGAALNIMGHGCIHGYPAVLFAQLLSHNSTLTLTDSDTSWIASVSGITGIIGNFVSPVLMSTFGRQKAHLITTIPALIGWFIFPFANSVTLFVVARLLHGLALGLRTPLAAILVAEYTESKYRGMFLGTFAISLGMGILLVHLWGTYLSWTMTAVVSAMLSLASMLIIVFSPESPSWLISKGRFEEGKDAFTWLRGDGAEQQKELDSIIDAQKAELTAIEQKKTELGSVQNTNSFNNGIDYLKNVLKILKNKEFYKPSIIAICMLVTFEFGGAHMVPAYGNIILQRVLDVKDLKDITWQFTTIDVLRTVSAFFAIFLLKCVRRRVLLFTSGVMTVLSLSAISLFIYVRQAHVMEKSWVTDFVPMSLMILYTLSFCLGIVSLNWVICGEVFPLAHRSLGSTLSTAFLTPSYMISLKTAPYLYSSIGVEGAFLVYSTVLTICLGVMFALLPETKDRTLQDIEDSFKK